MRPSRCATRKQRRLFSPVGSTILTALEDVENAIVAYTREGNRREALVAAAGSNQRAVDLATAYTRGLTDFLKVLDAQRNLLQAQKDLAQSETTVSTDFVALYKAVGGGWTPFPGRLRW